MGSEWLMKEDWKTVFKVRLDNNYKDEHCCTFCKEYITTTSGTRLAFCCLQKGVFKLVSESTIDMASVGIGIEWI